MVLDTNEARDYLEDCVKRKVIKSYTLECSDDGIISIVIVPID